jgi:hypothetical protein
LAVICLVKVHIFGFGFCFCRTVRKKMDVQSHNCYICKVTQCSELPISFLVKQRLEMEGHEM